MRENINKHVAFYCLYENNSTGFDKVVNWRKGLPGATQTCAVGEPLAGMAYS